MKRGDEGRELTVRERILVHLQDTAPRDPAGDVSSTLTQPGIAQATGIERKHVAQYVRPLIEEGLVVERLAHIEGSRQRKKICFLTMEGRLAASRLRAMVLRRAVAVQVSNGDRKTMTLDEARRQFFRGTPILTLMAIAAAQGHLRPMLGGSVEPSAYCVEMLQDAPRVDTFVGRGRELSVVTAEGGPQLIVVQGIAGIGKSWFGAKACELLRGKKNLFWHRMRPWDTAQSVLASLGDFLHALEKPALRSVLARGDGALARRVLGEDLPRTNALLVFDDAHEAPPDIVALLRDLKEALNAGGNARALVLTRRTLPFYDRRDVVLERAVGELDLRGLRAEEFQSLMPASGESMALRNLARKFGGHPLLIQLARTVGHPATAEEYLRDAHRFLEEEVYRELSEPERRMMKLASLYRVPVPRDALFADGAASGGVVLSLRDKSLIHSVGDGAFEVHDTIRDFFASTLTPSEGRSLRKFALAWLRELAASSREAGDVVSCVNYLSNALELSPRAELRTGLQDALGDAFDALGDLPSAVTAYKQALKASEPAVSSARLHRKIASAFAVRGEISAAVDEIWAARQALRNSQSVERGWIDLVQSRIAGGLEDWSEAKKFAASAIDILREYGAPAGEADALLQMGHLAMHGWMPDISDAGEKGSAERYLSNALALAAKARDVKLTSQVHLLMAHYFAYHRPGQVDTARSHLSAMQALPEAESDHDVRLAVLMLEAWLALDFDADYATAESLFWEAISLSRKIHDAATHTSAHGGLALISYFRGDIPDARRGFDRFCQELSNRGSLGGRYELGRLNTVGEAWWLLAECCLLEEDFEGFEQIRVLLEAPDAARIAHAISPQLVRATGLFLRGDQEASLSAFEEATRYAEQGFAETEAVFVHYPHLAHLFHGVALRVIGREGEARDHINRASEILRMCRLKALLSVLPDRERRLVDAFRCRPMRDCGP